MSAFEVQPLPLTDASRYGQEQRSFGGRCEDGDCCIQANEEVPSRVWLINHTQENHDGRALKDEAGHNG